MTQVPKGFCQCGCGRKTTVSPKTAVKYGYVKGEPRKYIHGHNIKSKSGQLYRVKHLGYWIIKFPGHHRACPNGYVKEHILIAEKALGKPLPPGAEVHHINGIKDDNNRGNLIICQNKTYHRLLEQRMEALKACGHAHWRKCKYCKQYDSPDNLYVLNNGRNRAVWHRSCHAAKRRVDIFNRNNISQTAPKIENRTII